MSEKITVTYEIPEPPGGWVYDGARKATRCDMFFNGTDWIGWWDSDESQGTYPIAIRKQQWRPATEADVGRTDARFLARNKELHQGKLIHILQDVPYPYVAVVGVRPSNVSLFDQCEVPIT